ncbi:MAG: TM0106 family RecB-like putative nuclease [Patescibacteria group bacterium]
MHITASQLYNYIVCPHRVWRDVYGPADEKIQKPNPFVQMLWDKGVQHEKNVVEGMKVLDLSTGSREERFEKTKQAMKDGVDWIYQGVLIHDNLLGIPDLLKKMPDGHYIPVDVKSGMGLEGVDEETEEGGRPKKHYAAQLCLYVEVLQNLGFAEENKAKVIDIHGNEIDYNLDEMMGKRTPITWWEFYQQIKYEVQKLLENREQNKPAMAGVCKLCPWYNSCKSWAKEEHDLTNIFYLGRSKRDKINEDLGIERVEDIINVDLEEVKERKSKNKQFLSGVGEKTLAKIMVRADILANDKGPVVYDNITFPEVTYELFFDIEDDPTQDFVYLHGVYERNNETVKERFLDFTAKECTPKGEKEAWAGFWDYIHSLPQKDYAVYYYSPHEKTVYKKMQKLYPDVVSKEEVDDFYDSPNVIDLYQIVLKSTDWPLSSYGIKAIAVYLGFSWRDKDPSGANSIEWFNNYLKTKDKKDLQRILDYNEDDCKATMVVKDGIEKLANSIRTKL